MVRCSALYLIIAVAAGCEPNTRPEPTPGAHVPPPWLTPPLAGVNPWTAAAGDPVIVAAGDIAMNPGRQMDTAALVGDLRRVDRVHTILAVGDTAYPGGAAADFASWYEPSWGRFKDITRAVPGNHEYYSSPGDATGYFDYFNGPGEDDGPGGPRGQGWYSFDIGDWHLIGLNTSIDCAVVPCDAASPQARWLAADLAAHPAACTLAFFHQPRYQQGIVHGDLAAFADLWHLLYAGGVDVAVTGHEHMYEEDAPADDQARRDEAHGIRNFVVGTGGAFLYTSDSLTSGPHTEIAEVVDSEHWGVLELALHPTSYSWRFVSTMHDVLYVGTGSCHGAPPPPAPP